MVYALKTGAHTSKTLLGTLPMIFSPLPLWSEEGIYTTPRAGLPGLWLAWAPAILCGS